MNAFICFSCLLHQTYLSTANVLRSTQYNVMRSKTESQTLITSNTLYTTDYLQSTTWFPETLVAITTDTEHVNKRKLKELPLWNIQVDLNNTNGAKFDGFVAMQYMLYEPRKSGSMNVRSIPVINDLCQIVHEHASQATMDEIKLLFERSYPSEHSFFHFHPFSFKGTNPKNQNQKNGNPTLTSTELSKPEIIHLNTEQHIDETGVWVNVIYVCTEKNTQNSNVMPVLNVDAHQIAINPLGYLGGEYLISLPILALFGVGFLLLSLLWIHWTLKWHRVLLPHHWLIYFGINIALIETVFHFYHYKSYNHLGKPDTTVVWIDACFTILLATYVRVTMALVSTGWGIAKPTVSMKEILFVTAYSITYICVYSMVKFHELNALIHELSFHSYQGWIIAVALLDGIMNWYIFENLANVFERLKIECQWVKFHVYRKLGTALLTAMMMSVIVLTSQIYFVKNQFYTDPNYWCLFWFLRDGVWRLIFFAVGITVICIWRPHQHSWRYAYSKELARSKQKGKKKSNKGRQETLTPAMKKEDVEPDFDISIDWTQHIYDAAMDLRTPHFPKRSDYHSLGGDSTGTVR